MAYDPNVVDAIRRIGQQRKVPRRWLEAAYATGIVESGLQNLDHGDADSKGWRQERASIYKDPTNLEASVNRFYDELKQFDRGQSVGELAADVQRPAAQYRGRYGEVLGKARSLAMGSSNGGAGATSIQPSQAGVKATTPTGGGTGNVFDYLASTTPTTNPLQAQLQRGWQLLSSLQGNQSGGSVAGAGAASDLGPTDAGGNASLQSIMDQANKIDTKNRAGKLPYKWGGGHGGSATSANSPITPLDCSGAVSRALGVDPRVSGQFAKWGKPGEGKNVTIYANDHHVLMKINGHFWGTSKTNPGGGAGWIPQSAISDDYLKNFTKRHPPGM